MATKQTVKLENRIGEWCFYPIKGFASDYNVEVNKKRLFRTREEAIKNAEKDNSYKYIY